MAHRSDREQGHPAECPRRHSLLSRVGPSSRIPSRPAVTMSDRIKQAGQKTAPDHPPETSNYSLQCGSHPQKTLDCGTALGASRQVATLALVHQAKRSHPEADIRRPRFWLIRVTPVAPLSEDLRYIYRGRPTAETAAAHQRDWKAVMWEQVRRGERSFPLLPQPALQRHDSPPRRASSLHNWAGIGSEPRQ
jgi:hypothetical protein